MTYKEIVQDVRRMLGLPYITMAGNMEKQHCTKCISNKYNCIFIQENGTWKECSCHEIYVIGK